MHIFLKIHECTKTIHEKKIDMNFATTKQP